MEKIHSRKNQEKIPLPPRQSKKSEKIGIHFKNSDGKNPLSSEKSGTPHGEPKIIKKFSSKVQQKSPPSTHGGCRENVHRQPAEIHYRRVTCFLSWGGREQGKEGEQPPKILPQDINSWGKINPENEWGDLPPPPAGSKWLNFPATVERQKIPHCGGNFREQIPNPHSTWGKIPTQLFGNIHCSLKYKNKHSKFQKIRMFTFKYYFLVKERSCQGGCILSWQKSATRRGEGEKRKNLFFAPCRNKFNIVSLSGFSFIGFLDEFVPRTVCLITRQEGGGGIHPLRGNLFRWAGELFIVFSRSPRTLPTNFAPPPSYLVIKQTLRGTNSPRNPLKL